MGIRDPPYVCKENVSLENILKNTLEDKSLMEKIKELTAVWDDYSYTPSHYIEICEWDGRVMERKPESPLRDIKKVLAIDATEFWKLEYEWDLYETQQFPFIDDGDHGEWKFKDIKKLSPQEVVQEFPYLSGKKFQNCLAWALKRQERDNKLYQKYRIVPAEPLSAESFENMLCVGVSRLFEFAAFPVSILTSLYKKAYKKQTENG